MSNQSAVDRWVANVSSMHAEAESMGAEYFVFLQPTMGLEGLQSRIAPEGSSDWQLQKKHPRLLDDNYIRSLNDFYSEAQKECRDLHFCVDITEIGPPEGDAYHDPRHHNENGNELIAENIHAVLFP